MPLVRGASPISPRWSSLTVYGRQGPYRGDGVWGAADEIDNEDERTEEWPMRMGRDAQRPAGRNRFVCLANVVCSSPKRRSHALTASLCLVRPSARTHACCPRLAGLAVRAALSSFLQGFKVCCWQIKTHISHRITAGGKRRVAIPGVVVAGHPVQKGMDAAIWTGVFRPSL